MISTMQCEQFLRRMFKRLHEGTGHYQTELELEMAAARYAFWRQLSLAELLNK